MTPPRATRPTPALLIVASFVFLANAVQLAAQAVVTWNNASASWHSANWSSGGPPTASDTAQVGGGAANVDDADVTIGKLTLSAGNVGGAKSLTVTGTGSTWAGGSLNGTGAFTIANTGSLAISSGSDHDFNARAIVNNGTVDWTAGYLRSGNGGSFTNNGAFNATANGYSLYNPSFNGSAGSFVFANNATFARSGTGNTQVDTTFNNAGTVSVTGGRLTLNGGGTSTGAFNVSGSGSDLVISNSYTLNSGASMSGPVRVTGGTFTASGTIPVSGFSFEGGSLQGAQSFSGGALSWIGGNWNASGVTTTIAASATLTMGNGADHDFNGRTIVNDGNVNWISGYIRGGNGSAFTNNGTFNDTNASGYTIHNPSFNGSAGTFVFTNNGNYVRDAANATAFDTTFDNNGTVTVTHGDLRINAGGTMSATGRIAAATGTNVYFTNNYTIANGAALGGDGIYWLTGGTLTVPGTITVSTLNQTGGTLADTNTLKGTINWHGGNWNASAAGFTTTIDTGATLNLGAGADHDFNQRGIINKGTVEWTSGYIRGGNGSTFTNNGTFNDKNTSGYTIHNPSFNGSAGTFVFTNNGSYVRSATGTSYIDVPFDNNGTVTVTQGDLRIEAGGTMAAAGTIGAAAGTNVYFTNNYTISNGASLSGDGTYWLTGGTLTVPGTITVSTLNQTGGTLADTNTLKGTINWSGGNWNASAAGFTTTIDTGATLNLGAGADHDFNQRGIINKGTVNWTSGYIRGGNGSTFTNNGTFNDKNTSGYTIHNPSFNGSAGTFVFTNNGSYVRNATGTSYIDVPFDNNGTVTVTQGDLRIEAGGTIASNGSISADTGTNVYFTNGYVVNNGSSLAGQGTYWLTGGTLSLTGQINVGTFNQTAGSLAGTGIIQGTFNWNGGNWNAGVTGSTTTIGSTGTLNLGAGADHDFNYRGIVNDGIVNWASGYIRGGNGSTIINNGAFNDSNGSGYTIHNPSFNGSAGAFNFINNGTYTRVGGNTTYFDVPFNNNGTLNLNAATNGAVGDIRLQAGGTMAATSRVNAVAGTHLYFASNYAVLDGAQFSGAGSFNQIAGTLTLDGTLKASSFLWSGGTWNAANNAGVKTTLDAASILNLTAANDDNRAFNGRTIDNGGTVNWSAGYLRGGNGSEFINNATFNDKNASGYSVQNSGGGNFSFTNNGTYTRDVGNTTFFDVPFNNNGNVNLAAGAGGAVGDIRLQAGGTMSATSVVDAVAGSHLYFASNYTIAGGARFTGTGSFNQIAATLTLSGALKASSFLWSGGNWNLTTGTPSIANGTILNLTAANDDNRVFTGTLDNRGTVNWSSAYLRGTNGSQFVNNASFNDQNASGYSVQNSGGGNFSFTNNGTYTRDVGNTTFFDVPFNNNGTVNLAAVGDIRLQGGGMMSANSLVDAVAGSHLYFISNYTLLDGARFTGAGVFNQISGALTIDGALTASSFLWSGGNWSAADNSGLTTIIASGTILNLTAANDDSRAFNGRTIDNRGTVNWSSAYLRGANGSAFINNGIFNDQNSPGYAIQNLSTGTFTFTNQGGYYRAVGGTSYIQVPFVNSGTISVSSGALRFQNTFTQSSGPIMVSNGASIQFDQNLNLAAGSLSGSGTVVGNVSATAGFISPSASSPTATGTPGQLNITGNLSLVPASILLFELGGTGKGTTYDFLSISGSAALGGAQLQLKFANSFQLTASPADVFTVVTATSLSGSFMNVANGARLLTNDGFGSFLVSYGSGSALGSNSVVLSQFVAVPEPTTWALMVFGALALLAPMRRRR